MRLKDGMANAESERILKSHLAEISHYVEQHGDAGDKESWLHKLGQEWTKHDDNEE
jgi:hypothetical protein